MGQIFFHVVKGEPFQLARGEQTSRAHMLFARVELDSDFEKKDVPAYKTPARMSGSTGALLQ